MFPATHDTFTQDNVKVFEDLLKENKLTLGSLTADQISHYLFKAIKSYQINIIDILLLEPAAKNIQEPNIIIMLCNYAKNGDAEKIEKYSIEEIETHLLSIKEIKRQQNQVYEGKRKEILRQYIKNILENMLLLAAKNGKTATVKLLDKTLSELPNNSAEKYLPRYTINSTYDLQPEIDKMDMMESSHASVSSDMYHQNYYTPLMFAAANVHLNIVEYFVEKYPEIITTQNNMGYTAEMLAVINGHTEILKYFSGQELLNFRIKDKEGNTAVDLAAIHGHLEIIEILIQPQQEIPQASIEATFLPFTMGGIPPATPNLKIDFNKIVKLAAENGHLPIVEKYIEHANEHFTIFRAAFIANQFETASYVKKCKNDKNLALTVNVSDLIHLNDEALTYIEKAVANCRDFNALFNFLDTEELLTTKVAKELLIYAVINNKFEIAHKCNEKIKSEDKNYQFNLLALKLHSTQSIIEAAIKNSSDINALLKFIKFEFIKTEDWSTSGAIRYIQSSIAQSQQQNRKSNFFRIPDYELKKIQEENQKCTLRVDQERDANGQLLRIAK